MVGGGLAFALIVAIISMENFAPSTEWQINNSINNYLIGSRSQRGGLAQLVERLLSMQKVGGSIPPISIWISSCANGVVVT